MPMLPLLPKPPNCWAESSEQPLEATRAKPRLPITSEEREICFTGALLKIRRLRVRLPTAPSQNFSVASRSRAADVGPGPQGESN